MLTLPRWLLPALPMPLVSPKHNLIPSLPRVVKLKK